MTTPHICRCGSGEPPYPLRDGYGIFMAYVCDHCVKERRTENALRELDASDDESASGK